MTTDVLIVGGGPAGLAAALALRQRGAAVTVLDARQPPIDKACGEGLMPDSRRELTQLGVTLDACEGGEFRGIRFAHHQHKTLTDAGTAQFPNAGIGIGMRRQRLHARLVQAALDAGVSLQWRTPAQLLSDECVLANGVPVRYRWLIGADGQSSRVRRWAGLESGTTISRRFGFRRHYAVEPWSPYVEVHWAQSGQAYVTPVSANEVCVATVARDPQCRLETILGEMPWLRHKLRAGRAVEDPLDTERGALTTTRSLKRVAHGRVALLGDASGSADAITGEGMAMAFRQALLLAECLDAPDAETAGLARYNHLHAQNLQLPQTMARVMLYMDRFPAFRARAIRLLATEPALFARMLGVHVGAEALAAFVLRKGLHLAWRLALPAASPAPDLLESESA